MNGWTLRSIAQLCEGRLANAADPDLVVPPGAVSFDSRSIRPGELFVALRGARDGHEFVPAAARAGAAGAIVAEDYDASAIGAGRDDASATPAAGFALIRVPDPLAALHLWAGRHRRAMPAVVIAVTGSSGKTTTKDRLGEILAANAPTMRTEGNWNNHIGVPLTLLHLRPEHRWGIVEIAMNHPGEIAPLARLAAPDHVLLTTVGWAHIGAFGTREAILEEKLDAARALGARGLFFHEADPWLLERLPAPLRDRPRRTFGLAPGADLHPEAVEYGWEGTRFRTPYTGQVRLSCPGRGALQAAIAASLVARELSIEGSTARASLEAARPRALRMEPRAMGGAIAILDCYNASPESSLAAVSFLAETPGARRRWLAFGEMRELGASSEESHRQVGERAAAGVDGAFFFGEGCRPAREAYRAGSRPGTFAALYTSHEALAADLAPRIEPGDRVLFKGARATAMETVYEACRRRLEGRG